MRFCTERASLKLLLCSAISVLSLPSTAGMQQDGSVIGPRSRSSDVKISPILSRRAGEFGPLRLRGGGCFDSIGSCFGCLGQGQSMMDGDDKEPGQKRKRKVGRMERSAEMAAPLKKVYRVITDFQHYGDWSGNGIKKCVIKNRRPGMMEIAYTTGAFGVQFQFSLYWGLAVKNKVSFRTVTQTSMLRFVKGEYVLSPLPGGHTHVHFTIIADVVAPIPMFLKMAIAKILVHIAINDLKRYVESEECTANLAKYDKQERLLVTMRQRMTRLCTQVPGLLPVDGQPLHHWLRRSLIRLLSTAGRLAAGWFVLSNIFWRPASAE